MLTFFNITNCVGVSDNGDGTYRVDMADGSSRQATPTEILQAAKASKLADIRAKAKELIYATFSAESQINCADGTYSASVCAPLIAHKQAVISASNTAEDAVDAATTVNEVNAVEAVWP